MNLVDVQSNGGIHAPTIRYHNGKFYIITTNVYQPKKDEPAQMINFIITASSPEGPWSNPIIVEGAPGIDPHIFLMMMVTSTTLETMLLKIQTSKEKEKYGCKN